MGRDRNRGRDMLLKRFALAALVLGTSCFDATAAEPVRRISIHVQPYYEAARNPGDPPHVAVGESISRQLSSNRREDIVAIRDRIVAEPGLITPMAMMVLAIRLYDVG